MAAKKRSKKTRSKRTVNKSELVRSMAGAPAKDIVAAAAKQGVKLTDRYVYAIRSNDKNRRSKAPAGPGRRPGRPSAQRSGTLEAQLRQIIGEIGLTQARQVLSEVEAAFAR